MKVGNVLYNSDVLIKEAIDGDETSFRKLYDAVSGKMYSLCLRYCGNVDEANDVFQDSFVKLYKCLPSFRFEGSFEGWCRTIFVSCCLDHLKKRKKLYDTVEEFPDVPSGDFTAQDKIEMDDLIAVIAELPDGYRTVINLALIEEYSHKEIGEVLGISEAGSKSKLHKARILLKRNLIDKSINN